jgi:hypothetical protein
LTALKAEPVAAWHAVGMSAALPTFRSVVLPREHGSWALAFEPVALGLLVAPSGPGAALAVAVAAGFLARRPLKVAWTETPFSARRADAACWFMALTGLAGVALVAAGTGGLDLEAGPGGWIPLWPLLLAVPCGALFLWFDLRQEMREAEAELAGSAAFACVPAAFATLAGWSAGPALALAALMLARSLPTVLVVRAYLRLQKRQPAARASALAAAAAAVALAAGLAHAGLAPAFAAAPFAVLLVRAVLLLAPFRPDWPARRVGMLEAVLGVATLAGLAAAYGLGERIS